MRTPSMLSFDCKSQVYFMLHKSLGDEQMAEQTQKLEDLLARLEEERVKIDAFKRELPMCMQLLTNAMEASRQQLHLQRSNEITTTPILEEFIPLKNDTLNENDQSAADKAGWMTSAQLPNQENEMEGPQSVPHHQETEIRLALGGKQKIDALLPFSDVNGHRRHHDEFLELALASSHKEALAVEDGKTTAAAAAATTTTTTNNNNNSQAQRKVRRCWSPDLHRRFVNALHMLGGSQVATPKQIRELMKVDGLTNDEVKSHLQKYRLHTRRPSPSPQTAAPQVVVLGGIWVPPEYAAAAAANHHAAPMFFSPAPPQVGAQDMYPAIAPLPQPTASPSYQIHHLGGDVPQQQQQIHLYRAKSPSTKRNGSPESDIQGADDDPSESIEEGKSESAGSWKGDSDGENGGERRSRVEGEESKASSIVSLKF